MKRKKTKKKNKKNITLKSRLLYCFYAICMVYVCTRVYGKIRKWGEEKNVRNVDESFIRKFVHKEKWKFFANFLYMLNENLEWQIFDELTIAFPIWIIAARDISTAPTIVGDDRMRSKMIYSRPRKTGASSLAVRVTERRWKKKKKINREKITNDIETGPFELVTFDGFRVSGVTFKRNTMIFFCFIFFFF